MSTHSFSWLKSFQTQAKESKSAMVIASTAVLIVITTVAWNAFFSQAKDINLTNTSPDKSIHITEKPNINTSSASLKAKKNTHTQAERTPSQETQNIKQKITIGHGHFYVQVGAFKQSKLARLMLEKMKAKYRHAKIVAKHQAHAVWVGPVETRNEADQLKKIIQRRNNIQGFITTEK